MSINEAAEMIRRLRRNTRATMKNDQDGHLMSIGNAAYRSPAIGLIVIAAMIQGCGDTFPLINNVDQSEIIDGNRDTTLTSPLGKTSGEPNDSFDEAIVAVLDDGVARLQGNVVTAGDMDVYMLGALAPGDRVVVDATTPNSDLDVSIAMFDADFLLVVNNDDRSESPTLDLDSYVDWITRHESDPYYLVVTNSAFAQPGDRTGTYSVDVTVSGGASVPEVVGQYLMLDFDGGTVEAANLEPRILAPFSAEGIDERYRGQDDVIKEQIRAVVEQNFEDFDVTVLTSDDPPPAESIEYSTIHFGGFHSGAFGIAEAVDLYNTDYCDDAIIYTESFDPSVFSTPPTALEMGTAIGNIASHEAGHLLGLNHVDDDDALMDDRSAADAFLEDQEFMEAPLSSDIMPIGLQDAVTLLTETVGLLGL